jgi:hypothetical protein
MSAPFRNIAVGKSESKKARLQEYLARTRPGMIGATEWSDVVRELAPVSESYLRNLLRDCGLPLHPLIEGVRQDSFENLERTLGQLLSEYEAGDPTTKRTCRNLVIRAKDHARFALTKKPEKEEMLLWMITWLENPPAFPVWLGLRKRQLAE